MVSPTTLQTSSLLMELIAAEILSDIADMVLDMDSERLTPGVLLAAVTPVTSPIAFTLLSDINYCLGRAA
jgi:hypothetical protein